MNKPEYKEGDVLYLGAPQVNRLIIIKFIKENREYWEINKYFNNWDNKITTCSERLYRMNFDLYGYLGSNLSEKEIINILKLYSIK
jgi:hypothetical protein